MRFRRAVRPLAAVVLIAALVPFDAAGAASQPASSAGGDAVVVAVIDDGLTPYHWDFRASKMPQATNGDRSDDVPLNKPPHTWLKGFPAPSTFTSYRGVPLTLSNDREASIQDLRARDDKSWRSIRPTGPRGVNYHWFPGTKVIGAMTFEYEDPSYKVALGGAPRLYANGHGTGSASVSVGNLHGTCPECLLVHLVVGDATSTERALAWAQSQPWIDVITNSYALQTSPVGFVRDGLYGGPTELQRKASERGQTIAFSAGNGVENGFVVPNSTLTSTLKGPDWVLTVGATDPADVDYSGSGKPADVAGIGSLYPSSYGATTTTGKGLFGGTSNATPTLAGTYGRALWLTRQAMRGPSRVQGGGVISTGSTVACGRARKACELGDGKLTRAELQDRLFKGATPTKGGFAGRRTIPGSVLGLVPVPVVGGAPVPFVTTPSVADTRFASEGHGTYRARLDGDKAWKAEFDSRVWDVLRGARPAPERPAGETEWFRVDSHCRQHIWGQWEGGAYLDDARTPLPAPDPVAWPTRTLIQTACPALVAPPRT